MTINFQENVLKFLVQNRKQGKKFIPLIDEKIFDVAILSVCYQLLSTYLKNYGTVPRNSVNLIEFFDREAKKKKLEDTDDAYLSVVSSVEKLFVPIDDDTRILKEALIRYAKGKMYKNMVKEYSQGVNDLGSDFSMEQIEREMRKIGRISSDDNYDGRDGKFLIKERRKVLKSVGGATTIRTKFPGMNAIQKIKGFSSPEVVVVMAGPKAGKTTFLVNMAVGFIKNGLKVFYADKENGIRRIQDMSRQVMMECTPDDMYDNPNFDEEFEKLMKNYEKIGGDMRIEYYPPDRHSTADIRDTLKELEEETGWVPDVIISDYFDKMKPEDHTIKEKRLQLQAVYTDWKGIASEFDCPIFTVSQVNRKAVEKSSFSIGDISEDFGKVANCDSLWAYCANPEEKKLGIFRLIPVANRGGKDQSNSNVEVDIKVDWEKALVEEDGFEIVNNKLRKRQAFVQPSQDEADEFFGVKKGLDESPI